METIKLSKDDFQKKSNTKIKIDNTQITPKTNFQKIKKPNTSFIDFLKIENGRLTGFDTAIKQMGYKDAEDFKKYKEENPELFEAMGGVKYEVGTIPEKDSEIKITAINNLINNYKNTDIKEIESIVKKSARESGRMPKQ